MGKGVWGIDVSRYSVKAVRLEQTKDGVHLTDIAVVPYGVSGGKIDDVELESRMREALKQLKYSHRVGSERVVLSLPTHSAYNRLVKLPPFEDIDTAIQHEAKQQIPFGLDQVIWGYQIVERQYQTGEEKDVILLAIKKDVVENFLKIVEEIGLNVDQIQLSPVAIYNFLAFDQDVSVPTVVLELGADSGSLLVLENERFWVRNLPVGGNDITKAVQEALNVPFDKAEQHKTNAMNSPHVEKIYEAVVPVYKNIVSEIHRSLGYYKSISKSAKFEQILMLGNGTKSLNFQRFMGQALQIQASKIQKLNKIIMGTGIDAELLNNQMQSIETALGLALQGCGITRNKVNLLPDAYRRRKEGKKKYPVVAVGIAILFATFFWAYSNVGKRIEDVDRALRESEKAEIANTIKREFDAAKETGVLPQELDLVGPIGVDRSHINRLMAEIFRRFPEDNNNPAVLDKDKVWLMDMQIDLWDGNKPGIGGPGGLANPVIQNKRTLSFKMVVAITHYLIDKVSKSPQGPERAIRDGSDFIVKTLKLNDMKLGDIVIPLNQIVVSPDGMADNLKLEAGAGGAPNPESKFLKYIVKFDVDLPAPQK
jgi:type IV pilus assembly protein PilM